jgi:hypothetical protein
MTNRMTPSQRGEIRARVEASVTEFGTIDIVKSLCELARDGYKNEFACLSAHAQTDEAALLSDLDAADAEIAELRGEVERLREAIVAHCTECPLPKDVCSGDAGEGLPECRLNNLARPLPSPPDAGEQDAGELVRVTRCRSCAHATPNPRGGCPLICAEPRGPGETWPENYCGFGVRREGSEGK